MSEKEEIIKQAREDIKQFRVQLDDLIKNKELIYDQYLNASDEGVKQAYKLLFDDVVQGIKSLHRRIVLLEDALQREEW